MDIRDLRPISKDPESPGPIVLLVGTDPDEEDYYGDYISMEGLILPRYVEATDYLKGDVYLQSGGGGGLNYEDYRDYLFTADYIDGDNDRDKSYLPNNILVDDTKWAWKTPGLSDDEDVDISIHGNQYVLLLTSPTFKHFSIQSLTYSSRDILAEDLPVGETTLVPVTESPIIWGQFQGGTESPINWGQFHVIVSVFMTD